MELVATPGAADANSYLTLDEADELMESYAQFDRWDELEEAAQKALLVRGTRVIDRYQVWGPPQTAGQKLKFPRAGDGAGEIPDGVKLALLEFVDYVLEGSLEPLKKLQAEGVTSASILGQNSGFEKDSSLLPAGARAELDRLHEAWWPREAVQHLGDEGEDSIF